METQLARPNTIRDYSLILIICLAGYTTLAASRPQSPSPATPRPDYSQEAFVSEEDVTHVTFANDGTSDRQSSTRIRIQSGAGVQRFGVLTFPYESSTGSVDIDFIRVRKPDGTTVLTPPENVQDMASEITRQAPFYSDLHEKQVAVKGLSTGDVLEFQAHWRTSKPLAPGQFWFAFNFAHDAIFLHEQLRISVPRDRSIKWSSRDLKPVISEDGSQRVYTWTASQLETKSSEQQKTEQALTSYQTQRGKLPTAEIQISSFQNWQEIGRWYLDLQQDRAKATPEIRAKAIELTKGAADDAAKLHAIYNYVSTQFRYIGIAFGIGRYQPHTASEVLANQYGDCKDKHTLLAALLDGVGIKALPVFINSSQEIDPGFPSPGQFDHLLTAVPQGDHLLWLDTTPEVAPFAYLITPLRDKQALVVYPDHPRLAVTPSVPGSPASQSFVMEAKIADSGTLVGKVDSSVQGGDYALLLRAAFRSVPLPQWKDLIQRISYSIGFAGDVSDVSAGSPEKIDEPLHFTYTYTRKEYPDWKNGRISPPLPPLGLPVAPDEKPANPIWLGQPSTINLESRVRFPKGYASEPPQDVHLSESFADYNSSSIVKDGILITKRELVLKVAEIPLNQYDSYKKFSKAVADDHELYVAVSSGNSAAMPATTLAWNLGWNLPTSDSPEAARAFDDARQQFQDRNWPAGVAALNRAIRLDPKFTRAWLTLGFVYQSTQRNDEAIEAYRSATQIDPQQPIPYKVLGSALVSLQRYEAAIPAWKELIKIAPNDEAGPAGLATSLFGLQRYSEAASALEEAVSRNPKAPNLRLQLGSAYLHSGDAEKALQSFQAGLDLDSPPALLNNVAWEFAEANKKLSFALEWARKAVDREESSSQDIEVSDLVPADLNYATGLAAYWDTLGWVYYRLGNFPDAEKYLKAAWTLDQAGMVADHLGQVYDHQHKKQAAIRMYQLALFSFHLENAAKPVVDETRQRLDRLQPVASGTSSGERYSFTTVTDEVNAMRTVKLPRIVPGTATAEFFVVITQDKNSAVDVADTRFISGSEELRTAGKALLSAPFAFPFPDGGHPNLLRRGILSCYPATGCSFTLINVGDVRSIN